MLTPPFTGFSPKTLKFLRDLEKTNTRDWFKANKDVYDTEVKDRAQRFVHDLTPRLEAMTGHRHKAKIFRVHRDVRFSKDKTPYNPHLRVGFTSDSTLPSPPGWFFSLEPKRISLGCGVFEFDPSTLKAYRDRVSSADGDFIRQTIDSLSDDGCRLHDPHLKRVPRGFDAEAKHADLLRYKGLSAWLDFDDPKQATAEDFLDTCDTAFRRFMPLYDLLHS